ncbi:minor capsid protein [Mycobacterium gordonae]|nr:minor capsid protein [Mycobacterium gordonae]
MSAVPSDLYWMRRALANSAKAYNFTEARLRQLRKTYTRAIWAIENQIKAFYTANAEDGKLTPAAVQRIDAQGELTRLEALHRQIAAELNRLAGAEIKLTGEVLSDVYAESYYRSIFDVQQSTTVGAVFPRLATAAIDQAINTAWSGANYSSRVWKRRDKLAHKVDEIITEGVTLGQSNDKMTRKLADAMDASYSRASTLIRTETNYVYNQGALKGYAAVGVEQYEFLATLDMRTSEQCRMHDGRRFKVSEAQAGSNYPPLHPNCRSTVIPVMDDGAVGERIARSPEGDQYYVPGDMKYQEWYDKHVVGQYGAEQAAVYRKQVRNASSDRRQLNQYERLIGDDAPASLEDFQRMKYTDPASWAKMQRQAGTFRKINQGQYSDGYKDKLRDNYRYFAQQGHEFRNHALNRLTGQRTGSDRTPYTREDISRLLAAPPNYKQDDKLIRYRDSTAIISAADTGEVMTIISRRTVSGNWNEV